MNYCSIWNISYKYCFYRKAVAEGLNPFWILYCPADLLVFDFLLKKMFLSVEQSQSPVLILQPHLPWTQLDSGSHCPAKSTAWERWLWSRKKIVFTFVWDRDTGITCIWKPLPAKLECRRLYWFYYHVHCMRFGSVNPDDCETNERIKCVRTSEFTGMWPRTSSWETAFCIINVMIFGKNKYQ